MSITFEWNGFDFGRADFGNDLRDWIAFSLALLASTGCRDKEAALQLLYHEADSIIAKVSDQEGQEQKI